MHIRYLSMPRDGRSQPNVSVINVYSVVVSMYKCLSILCRIDTMTFNVSYQILSALIRPWYVVFVM